MWEVGGNMSNDGIRPMGNLKIWVVGALPLTAVP
jgi:hypothetical protein